MAGPRVCMGCERPIRDKVYISIPGLNPNSICIDCTEASLEKALNEARRAQAAPTMRSVISVIVETENAKVTARKNIPTAAGIKKAVDMGVLSITDLEDMLHVARLAEEREAKNADSSS